MKNVKLNATSVATTDEKMAILKNLNVTFDRMPRPGQEFASRDLQLLAEDFKAMRFVPDEDEHDI